MITVDIFEKILDCKAYGLNGHQTANELKLNYRTVRKYWDCSHEEFCQKYEEVEMAKSDNIYREEVVECLQKHPSMSAKQVAKYICRKRGLVKLEITERSLGSCIAKIRKELNIPKPKSRDR